MSQTANFSPEGTQNDEHSMQTYEPMLDPKQSRLTAFPINQDRHPLWKLYKTAENAATWKATDVNFNEDANNWESMTPDAQYFILHVLAFFASSDAIVNQFIETEFSSQVKWLEAKYFYDLQKKVENVHAETYSRMILAYVKDPQEKLKLLDAIQTFPTIKKMADWAFKWMEESRSFAISLIANLVFESVFFSGSFCAIFYIKKQGILPGLTQANELISRDENLHCMFGCLMFSYLQNKPSEETVKAIFKEGVDISKEFITDALPCSLIGMNADLMSQYIEFVADRTLRHLGLTPLYGSVNPFDFMELMGLELNTNFLDTPSSSYQTSGGERTFVLDAEF